MYNKKISIIASLVVFNSSLYSLNNHFLEKNNGIVDIGQDITFKKVIVPKVKVFKEPIITTVNNAVLYSDRITNLQANCHIDDNNLANCPLISGYGECVGETVQSPPQTSTYTATRKYVEVCNSDEVLFRDKCYKDENHDNIPDLYSVDESKYSLIEPDFIDLDNTYDIQCPEGTTNWGKKCKKIGGEVCESGYVLDNDVPESFLPEENNSNEDEEVEEKKIKHYWWVSATHDYGYTSTIIYFGQNKIKPPTTNPTVTLNSNPYTLDGKEILKCDDREFNCMRTYDAYSIQRKVDFKNNDDIVAFSDGNRIEQYWWAGYEVAWGRPFWKKWSGLSNLSDADAMDYAPKEIPGYSTPQWMALESETTIKINKSKGMCHREHKSCPISQQMLSTNGTCLITYNWNEYSSQYSCPGFNLNDYYDYGSPTLINNEVPICKSSISKSGNYQCGKVVKPTTCTEDGYFIKDGRCQYKEPYCGDNYYNNLTDKCEERDIVDKTCDVSTDKYISGKECIKPDANSINSTKHFFNINDGTYRSKAYCSYKNGLYSIERENNCIERKVVSGSCPNGDLHDGNVCYKNPGGTGYINTLKVKLPKITLNGFYNNGEYQLHHETLCTDATSSADCKFRLTDVIASDDGKSICFQDFTNKNTNCISIDGNCSIFGHIHSDEGITQIKVDNTDTYKLNFYSKGNYIGHLDSTCELAGRVGQFGYKSMYKDIIAVNANKSSLLFWDSYKRGHIGSITFLPYIPQKYKDVGFKYEYPPLYEKGFTSYYTKETEYYVNLANQTPSTSIDLSEEKLDEVQDLTTKILKTVYTSFDGTINNSICENKIQGTNYFKVEALKNSEEEELIKALSYNGEESFDGSCVVKSFQAKTLDDVDTIYKKIDSNPDDVKYITSYCNQNKLCGNNKCKDGYKGNIYNQDDLDNFKDIYNVSSTCTSDLCFDNGIAGSFFPYCGKKVGCPLKNNVFEKKDGSCGKYECYIDEKFDKEKKQCSSFQCPPDSTSITDDTCQKSY